MAKNKKAKEENNILLDGIPGADPKKEEDSKSFNVSLDFSEEESSEDVVFPEEGQEVEEISESELTAKDQEEGKEETEGEIEEETVKDAGDKSEAVADDTDLEATKESNEADTKHVEDSKQPMVPKSRLDEVLAKQRALQKQVDELSKSKIATSKNAPKYDFDKKETDYQELMLDGKLVEATQLRDEIRSAERAAIMFEVETKTAQKLQESQEISALQAKALEIQATYPIFDENSANYDADILKEAVDLRDAFMAQGYLGPDALEKAVNVTLTMKKPNLLAPKEEKKVDNVSLLADQKKKSTISKNIADSKSQPPAMKGESASSRNSKAVDLSKLSETEFNALPEETLRRLRGDFS